LRKFKWHREKGFTVLDNIELLVAKVEKLPRLSLSGGVRKTYAVGTLKVFAP
jgi:hypothetical protein